jgi:hypothetical protein
VRSTCRRDQTRTFANSRMLLVASIAALMGVPSTGMTSAMDAEILSASIASSSAMYTWGLSCSGRSGEETRAGK